MLISERPSFFERLTQSSLVPSLFNKFKIFQVLDFKTDKNGKRNEVLVKDNSFPEREMWLTERDFIGEKIII